MLSNLMHVLIANSAKASVQHGHLAFSSPLHLQLNVQEGIGGCTAHARSAAQA